MSTCFGSKFLLGQLARGVKDPILPRSDKWTMVNHLCVQHWAGASTPPSDLVHVLSNTCPIAKPKHLLFDNVPATALRRLAELGINLRGWYCTVVVSLQLTSHHFSLFPCVSWRCLYISKVQARPGNDQDAAPALHPMQNKKAECERAFCSLFILIHNLAALSLALWLSHSLTLSFGP